MQIQSLCTYKLLQPEFHTKFFTTQASYQTIVKESIWMEIYEMTYIFFMTFPPLGILGTHNGLLSSWLD